MYRTSVSLSYIWPLGFIEPRSCRSPLNDSKMDKHVITIHFWIQGSHSSTEVQHHWAWTVLGWEITRGPLVLLACLGIYMLLRGEWQPESSPPPPPDEPERKTLRPGEAFIALQPLAFSCFENFLSFQCSPLPPFPPTSRKRDATYDYHKHWITVKGCST